MNYWYDPTTNDVYREDIRRGTEWIEIPKKLYELVVKNGKRKVDKKDEL